MRHGIGKAALLLLIAGVAFAEDEPERVKRFGGTAPASSVPVVLAGTPSHLFVKQFRDHNASSSVALWRVSGPEPTPVIAASPHDAAPFLDTLWESFLPIGETVLAGTGDGLWRIDADEAPRRLRAAPRGEGSRLTAVGSVRGTAIYLRTASQGRPSELWRSDGTSEGTSVLFALDADEQGVAEGQGVTVGSVMFFPATTQAEGRELWRTDGTPEGTRLALALRPGPDSSNPRTIGKAGGALIVRAKALSTRETVLRTDGTPEGTVLIHESPSTREGTGRGVALGGWLLFTAEAERGVTALWRTDGTPWGTQRVGSVADCSIVAVAGGLAYLRVRGEADVYELWRTDGTDEGTARVADLGAAARFAGFLRGVPLGDDLVFHADTYAEGSSLWRTDGTEAGTRTLLPETDDFRVFRGSSSPNTYYFGMLASTRDAVWFAAISERRTGLWVSDGTADGSRAVPLGRSRTESLHDIAGSDGTVFVAATEEDTGRELWASDGTAEGTSVLTTIAPAAEQSWVGALTDAGDELIFSAGTGNSAGTEVWRATSTSAARITSVADADGNPGTVKNFARIDDLFFFNAGIEGDYFAWRTDGTAAGTFGLGVENSSSFHELDESVLFFAAAGGNDQDLWKTDGSVLGTTLVKQLVPLTGRTSVSRGAVFDGEFFFGANGDASGDELWRTDGTGVGTVVDIDLAAGSDSSEPGLFVSAGTRLFFRACATDGTPTLFVRDTEGDVTTVLALAEGGSLGIVPEIALGDDLLFVRRDDETGRELWLTDGTEEGTALVRDIASGTLDSDPDEFFDVGDGRVVFVANDAVRGRELWVTDGTGEGTLPVADLVAGPGSSDPDGFAIVGDDLYVRAGEAGAQSDLWRIPLAHLDDLQEPAPVLDLDPLPDLGPQGPEPSPLPDPPPPEPEPEPEPPDPEPLALDALRIRLNGKRADRDSLRAKFRVPIDCGTDMDGARLRLDIGGALVDVVLDARGRAKSDDGFTHVRVRTVKPKRKKDEPTELKVVVKLERHDLSTPLADENLAIPEGEKRVERPIVVQVTWCDVAYEDTATVRYRERRRIGTAKLVSVD